MAKQGRIAFCDQLLSSLDQLQAVSLPALLANADEQALHDFRISVRSLLSILLPWQAKLARQPRIYRALRLLKHWLRMSNAVRDYDVQRELLLQCAPAQRDQALAHWLQQGLLLRDMRLAQLQHDIASHPWSERLHQLKQDIQHFFLDTKCAIGRQLRRQRYQLAKRIAHRQNKLKHADAQHAGWHDLRIDCKKLRYLLENHRARCGAHWQRDARRAKALQDELGHLHDLCELQCQLDRAKLGSPTLASILSDHTAQHLQRAMHLFVHQ